MNAKELGLPETKTLRDQLVLFLVNSLLWPDEANAVLDIMAADESHEGVNFSEPVGGYPKQLVAVLQLSAAGAAVTWIDENKPQHFARAVLAEMMP